MPEPASSTQDDENPAGYEAPDQIAVDHDFVPRYGWSYDERDRDALAER